MDPAVALLSIQLQLANVNLEREKVNLEREMVNFEREKVLAATRAAEIEFEREKFFRVADRTVQVPLMEQGKINTDWFLTLYLLIS